VGGASRSRRGSPSEVNERIEDLHGDLGGRCRAAGARAASAPAPRGRPRPTCLPLRGRKRVVSDDLPLALAIAAVPRPADVQTTDSGSCRFGKPDIAVGTGRDPGRGRTARHRELAYRAVWSDAGDALRQ
jgi:hypothetical protein